MKKIKILLILVLTCFLCACSNNKNSIDEDEFKSIMRDNNYYVVNVKEQFIDYDYIKEAYIAKDSNNNFQIEFYILEDEANALAFYNYNKDIFEAQKTNISLYTNVDIGNNNKYTLTTDDSYKVLSRIDDTAIYIDVDKKYKSEINDILKKLGY